LKSCVLKKIGPVTIALILTTCVFLHLNTPANAATSISLTVPSNITNWTLTPGQINDTIGILHVTASETSSWTITASDNNTEETNGYMTKYITSYETGIKLNKPMQVIGPNGTATLPSEYTIVSGNSEIDDDFEITFRQEVVWTDAPTSYRIVVTFTGTTNP